MLHERSFAGLPDGFERLLTLDAPKPSGSLANASCLSAWSSPPNIPNLRSSRRDDLAKVSAILASPLLSGPLVAGVLRWGGGDLGLLLGAGFLRMGIIHGINPKILMRCLIRRFVKRVSLSRAGAGWLGSLLWLARGIATWVWGRALCLWEGAAWVNQSVGFEHMSVRRVNRSVGFGCLSVRRANRSVGFGCLSVRRVNRSVGFGCLSVRRVNRSVGFGCLSVRRVNRSLGFGFMTSLKPANIQGRRALA